MEAKSGKNAFKDFSGWDYINSQFSNTTACP